MFMCPVRVVENIYVIEFSSENITSLNFIDTSEISESTDTL